MALTPTMAQTENRVRDLVTSGIAGGQKEGVIQYLQNKLAQLTMQGNVGSPEYIVVAGELQSIKNAAAKAQMAQPNERSVISDLLPAPLNPTPVMPQGVAQGVPQGVAPEDAGGLAAMEAPSMEGVATMAGGGLVAFADGGEVPRFSNGGTPFYAEGNRPFQTTAGQTRRQYTQEELDEFRRLKEMGLLEGLNEFVVDPVKRFFATSGRQDLQRGMTQGYSAQPTPGSLPADVRRADASEMAAVPMPAGVTPEVATAPTPSTAAASTTPRADKTQPGGGLDTLGKAQGLDMESAFAKAQSFIGDKLAGLGDPFKDIRDEMKTASEERKADLKNSAWMRLAEFGFGMAAGTSPYALANIGKAGVEALKGYADDLREKKKLDRDDRKMLADLKRLENADKRDNVIKTADLGLKIIGEMNADQRAQLAARTQLAAYGMPGKEERLVDRALRDPKFAEMYRSLNKAGGIDPRVKLFMDMPYAEKMRLKADNPAQYAMLEQLATAAFLPATVGTPDPSKIRP